jgi:hypothetical protein
MNLFAAARAGMPLTPGQRTVLRAIESVLLAALVSFMIVLPQLTNGFDLAHTNWGAMAGAFGVAFLMALAKWFKAHGDTPLADASENAAGALREFADVPNDVVIEPELPAMSADASEEAVAAPVATEASN